MNFYKHHLGDYDGATSHLSWDEDMAYTRLLRAYYRTEKPIPCSQAYRLTRASSKAQRAAVDSVLSEFFSKRDDYWHNKRADEEIETYQLQCARNRVVGNLGGRPKKTQVVLENNHSGYVSVSEKNPNQNQIPEPERSKAMSGKPDPHRLDAREILEFLNQKTGRHYEPVDANLNPIIARLKEGSSADDIRSVVAKKCREWIGDEKMAEYLRPKTLFNATNFANYKGELGAIKPLRVAL